MEISAFSKARTPSLTFSWLFYFSKNNSLTAYKFIKIRAVIGSDLCSDIDRCGDENNPIMRYKSCFPFVAYLRQRTSRLCFVFSFHIDGYASFLRRRRLEPLKH